MQARWRRLISHIFWITETKRRRLRVMFEAQWRPRDHWIKCLLHIFGLQLVAAQWELVSERSQTLMLTVTGWHAARFEVSVRPLARASQFNSWREVCQNMHRRWFSAALCLCAQRQCREMIRSRETLKSLFGRSVIKETEDVIYYHKTDEEISLLSCGWRIRFSRYMRAPIRAWWQSCNRDASHQSPVCQIDQGKWRNRVLISALNQSGKYSSVTKRKGPWKTENLKKKERENNM